MITGEERGGREGGEMGAREGLGGNEIEKVDLGFREGLRGRERKKGG